MEIIGTSKQSTVINASNICDALHDLVPFVQFKKCKNSSLGVFFHFFKIAQTVPNQANHRIWYKRKIYSHI